MNYLVSHNKKYIINVLNYITEECNLIKISFNIFQIIHR